MSWPRVTGRCYWRVVGGVMGLWMFSVIGVKAQTGFIQGHITDVRGDSLAGARVSATSPAATAPQVAFTDVSGRYVISALPAGTYAVTVTFDGFVTQQIAGVIVASGERRSLDVALDIESFSEQVSVVAVTPLLGSGVRRDRVPATVAVIEANEIEERVASSVTDLLNERFGAITLEGVTTNPHQPTLRFRGFTASPLLGLPQGIAVYQNGVRINESFGDTVQFDLMPQFAVDRVQLSAGTDPTYGLNALGGALALQLKNGFNNTGFRGEFSGGSFERFTGTAEYGANNGAWGLYVGATRFDETGWRIESPTAITQAVADVGYRRSGVDAGVTFTYADTVLNGNGPAPVELLAVDRSAVFTFPDITENRLALVQGRFNMVVTPTWSVQLSGYYRDRERQTLNGDEAEFSACAVESLPDKAPEHTLCHRASADDDEDDDELAFDDGNGSEDERDESPLVDVATGRFITTDDAAGDGAFNRSNTATEGYGGTLQATARSTLAGREHVFMVGGAADFADVTFGSHSEVGTLTRERSVTGSGLFAGLFGKAPDDIFNTAIDTENRAVGLYVSEMLSLTSRVHLTAAGRFNWTGINILDKLGTSLTGEHAFARFNPAVGAVFDVAPGMSAFARYAESNRAPTAAELSCADPAEPCRVPNAFISDPPLNQAVARSVEGGLRGRWSDGQRSVDWSVTVYRTQIKDDILFVASPELIGSGFFQNAGDTRRLGIDAELSGQVSRFNWYASYGGIEATFESDLELPGNDEVNDATTDAGAIGVEPGDRIPGIPRHSFKAGILQGVTSAWDLAFETVVGSSRVFVGDEGNDQAPLDGYGLVNVRTAYRLSRSVEFFARIDNLFDTGYATFGILAELELFLVEVPNASDQRFVGPGAPRSAFTGLRLRF